MRRDPIGLVWLAGLALAVLLTVFGPGLFGIDLFALVDRAAAQIDATLRSLGDPARAVIRAVAIASYVVFIALCVIARRRHLPSMGVAIAVTLLFVILAGSPGEWAASLRGAHWLLALLLNLGAAWLMTRRLRAPGRL